ncbi:hypothetical protein [Nostoc sp. DedSLP04]|uniref:hypothetical protein n=1 Tax=Nostoc sp. DedSLP04 TaxID=3075401 RepID=UPI002AD28BA9|nr:hypothetical protein [Nostoc sp. DedSLP04]MDZ8029793.1 hypothetical protein [Nostoc sp. DedSLP04]
MVRNRTPVAQEWEGNTPRANKSGIVAQNTGFVSTRLYPPLSLWFSNTQFILSPYSHSITQGRQVALS